MKFLTISLIVHAPDPTTGAQVSANERFRQVVDAAVLAEELGFDGFGIGERHERPFISSSPTVVLSHIAAKTSRIKLFTAVTTLSLLDPVRAYEDYATLDHLSNGRLELIIGKGNGSAQRELFLPATPRDGRSATSAAVGRGPSHRPEDLWERLAESYELFRRIWRQDKVTATTKFRPSLNEAEVWPRPFQQPIRVWHGSATSKESVDLAARYGDPLFSANVTNPIEPYAELIRYYRERWAFHGHDPAAATVGAGTAGFYAAATSQQALRGYAPVFAGHLAMYKRLGIEPVFPTLEDFVARSSALIGSPQQILEKVHRYHEQFGHTVMHLQAEPSGLTSTEHRASLERFQTEIAPVLRREIPDPPWDWEARPGAAAVPVADPDADARAAFVADAAPTISVTRADAVSDQVATSPAADSPATSLPTTNPLADYRAAFIAEAAPAAEQPAASAPDRTAAAWPPHLVPTSQGA